jgi:hypothetical protein
MIDLFFMESITFFFDEVPPRFESSVHEANNNNLSQLSWNKSDDAILTEKNHNQTNEGNNMQKTNALPQTYLKKTLDSLSALPCHRPWLNAIA